MRAFVSLLVSLAALTLSSAAQKHMSATDAATGQNTTGYTRADASGCKIWVPLQLHAPDYVPKYTGACKDGLANGKGSLQWLYAYAEMRPKTTWQGYFKDGVYVGDTALPHAIEPQPNGPLRVSGNVEIMANTGRIVLRTVGVNLCRCGHSNTKPICDGTHAKIGFVAE